MEKICTCCKTIKSYEQFAVNKRTPTGRYYVCRKCTYQKYKGRHKQKPHMEYKKRWALKRNRSENGKLRAMFAKLKFRNKTEMLATARYVKINYTYEDYRKHMYENTKFKEIYDNWVQGNYQRIDTPTTDRIQDKIGYTIENIQCLSLVDNINKYHKTKNLPPNHTVGL